MQCDFRQCGLLEPKDGHRKSHFCGFCAFVGETFEVWEHEDNLHHCRGEFMIPFTITEMRDRFPRKYCNQCNAWSENEALLDQHIKLHGIYSYSMPSYCTYPGCFSIVFDGVELKKHTEMHFCCYEDCRYENDVFNVIEHLQSVHRRKTDHKEKPAAAMRKTYAGFYCRIPECWHWSFNFDLIERHNRVHLRKGERERERSGEQVQ